MSDDRRRARRTFQLRVGLVLAFCAGVSPAWAEYASYRGEAQTRADAKTPCARLTETTLAISVVGRDDAPTERIDAYLTGDKIVTVHLTGNDVGHLSVTYPGEPVSGQLLQLRHSGPGAFSGRLTVKTVLQALIGCPSVVAEIHFANAGGGTRAAYEQAANLFTLDARSVQAYAQGLRGSVEGAVNVLRDALVAKEKRYGANHPQLLPYDVYLAAAQQAAGRFTEEIPLYRQGLTVCESAYGADSACTALLLANLSHALLEAGEFAEAESTARRSVAVCDRTFGPGDPLSGVALDALGAILLTTGRYSEAETTLNQALVFNKTVYGADSARAGLTLTNMGVLLRYTGQYRKAESQFRLALAIATKTLGPGSPLAIVNMIDLGQTLRLGGNAGEAATLCSKALESARRVLGAERPDHPALGSALLCVAENLRAQGHDDEAEPLYRQALGNDRKYLGADNPSVAIVEWMLARLLRTTNRTVEARELLKDADRIAHLSANEMLTWRIAGELMALYGASRPPNAELAVFYGKQAVNALQRLRGNLYGFAAAERQAFVDADEVNSIYRALAGLLVRSGRLSEAQQVLAMLKEQEFYTFTRDETRAETNTTVATFNPQEQALDALGGREVALGREYGELQARFQKDHALNAADRSRLTSLRAAMDTAQASFDARATAVALSARDPEAQRLRLQQITDLSRSLQGTLRDLGHGAVLAQYFMLDDRVQILLTTPDAQVAREALIKRGDLSEQILKFRRALSNPSTDPLPEAQALYRLLIGPILQDLQRAGAATLMLSLDDTLRYLPFAALHDGSSYLVENLAVSIVNEAARDKLGRPPQPTWKVWGLGVTKAHEGADALPWAGIELNEIAGPNGVLTGKVMLDGAFNEQSLRDGLDQAYPVIHIASHFRFAPGSMDDSVLLLGDGNLLTLAQIKSRLKFNGVDLLTLSACETALGDDGTAHHGIEVEGLGAIAQQAGANAVLATLWPVADDSTALLMRTLYQAHRDQHLTKAEALRNAQLALLHGRVRANLASKEVRGLALKQSRPDSRPGSSDSSPAFAHPFYWAPFILMGNWL